MMNIFKDYAAAYNGDNDTSTLMTVDEVAEYLKIGKNRTYDLLRDKKIKALRIGTVWRIPKQAVEEYIMKESGMIK